ncbi:S-layer homology domain-containing protein [Chengkuizengella axinellae]|uniref:S-layer homology domain-containing protein n=1 Tax=Chengkuizengella axinellae TaxID=3064388 RepID=A0ABT9J509_9BACL|nr:S-layer homology domain-containing protein [Chengkuizengella sp. 2205SS18-9]MDP5276706.1 S-layer homology domain-containing protein [Chengkuizengella sp. 2205SS18-9]
MRVQSTKYVFKKRQKSFKTRGGEMKVMKRSLSILLAIAMVFSSFVSIASAGELTAEEKFDELKDQKIFDGYTDGKPHLEDNMTREQAAKIIALVFDLDLDAPNNATFSDVDEDRWSYEYIEAAVDANIIDGIGNGKFAPKENVTIEEFAKMLVEGYSYLTGKEHDEDGTIDDDDVSAWAQEYVAAALDWDLIEEYNDYTDDADREFLVESAYAAVQQVEDFEESQKELKVESISADTLREVVIEFNADLDQASAEDTSNYDISDYIDIEDADLQSDDQTVILTVEKLDNQEEYTLEIDGLMSIGENVLEDFEDEFTPFDGDVPEVEGVEFTGPKSFRVTFNEPIEKAEEDDFTVKEGSKRLSIKDVEIDGDAVKVDLYSKLDDGEEYLIKVNGVEDFAGYANISFSETYDYEDSDEPPTAKVIDADQKIVEVEFDKPVTGLTNGHFYHSYSSWRAIGLYSDASLESQYEIDEDTEQVTKVYVVFVDEDDEGHALPSGDVEFTIRDEYDGSEIEDNWGNVFDEETYDLEITADRVPPEVSEIEILDGDEIKIIFNEPIGNLNDGDYEVYDEDGDEIDIDDIDPASNKESVILTLEDDQEGNTITLEISDLHDDTLYENEMEKFVIELDIEDSTFAGINRVEFDYDNGKDPVLYVVFNEEVNDTALDLDNYRLWRTGTTSYITFDGETDFYGNGKTVRIELTDSEAELLDDLAVNGDDELVGYELLVADVEDAEGNELNNFQLSSAIKEFGETRPIIVDGDVKVISRNEIQIQFNQELEEVSPDGFTITADWVENNIDSDDIIDDLEVEYNSDGTLVTFVLEYQLDGTTLDDIDLEVAFDGNPGNDPETYNEFGVAPEPFSTEDDDDITLIDKIAPELEFMTVDDDDIEKIKTYSVDGDNKVDHIILYFTEVIDESSVSKFNFEVEDHDVKDAFTVSASDIDDLLATGKGSVNSVDSDVIVLRVNELDDEDLPEHNGEDTDLYEELDIKIDAGVLEDLNGNTFEGIKSSDDVYAYGNGGKADVVSPVLGDLTISSSSGTNYVKPGETITVTVDANEAISVTSASIDGKLANVSNGADSSEKIVSIVTDATFTEGNVEFDLEIEDSSNNPTTIDESDLAGFGNSNVIFDKTGVSIDSATVVQTNAVVQLYTTNFITVEATGLPGSLGNNATLTITVDSDNAVTAMSSSVNGNDITIILANDASNTVTTTLNQLRDEINNNLADFTATVTGDGTTLAAPVLLADGQFDNGTDVITVALSDDIQTADVDSNVNTDFNFANATTVVGTTSATSDQVVITITETDSQVIDDSINIISSSIRDLAGNDNKTDIVEIN